MEKGGCVYILASRRNGTLYTGVTSDLLRRVSEHRLGLTPGFATRYGVKHLVWFEDHGDIEAAITREKVIKRWRRAWKIALIEAANPQWLDLWDSINAVPEGPLSHLQRPQTPSSRRHPSPSSRTKRSEDAGPR